MGDLDRLSLNTATTKRLTLAEVIDAARRAGLSQVGLWRDRVAEVGLAAAARMVADAGPAGDQPVPGRVPDRRRPSGSARGPGGQPAGHPRSGRPRHPRADHGGRRPRPTGRRTCGPPGSGWPDRIAELVPYAAEHDVRLVLEPLHPMYAADRAVISTLRPGPGPRGAVPRGRRSAWSWTPSTSGGTRRWRSRSPGPDGERRIASYQVCDFNLPIAADALLSRGMMGDGVIDFATISRWVTAAGYPGPVEVEIFNAEIWAADADQVLATLKQRWTDLVLPSLVADRSAELSARP